MNKMNEGQKREIKQLWHISLHYFSLSKRIKNKTPESILSKSIKIITQEISNGQKMTGGLRCAMLLTAHLASSAVRLDTIEHRLGKDISKQRLQKYNTLMGENRNLTVQKLQGTENHIIHFLLRNNIGHYEPQAISHKNAYNKVEEFFQALTIEQIFESMEIVIKSIKGDINEIISDT